MIDGHTLSIQKLNDNLRETFSGGSVYGLVQMTGGIANRPDREIILQAAKLFNDWSDEDEAHDWFNFIIPSKRNVEMNPVDVPLSEVCVGQLDAYGSDLEYLPPPADPSTVHLLVMTLMLGSEYDPNCA